MIDQEKAVAALLAHLDRYKLLVDLNIAQDPYFIRIEFHSGEYLGVITLGQDGEYGSRYDNYVFENRIIIGFSASGVRVELPWTIQEAFSNPVSLSGKFPIVYNLVTMRTSFLPAIIRCSELVSQGD